MDTPVSADRQKLTFICSMQTLDAIKRTCWLIEKNDESEKEKVKRICDDDVTMKSKKPHDVAIFLLLVQCTE